MKRFYETVSVVKENGSWEIQLDNRPVRTPSRVALALPTEALAERIAQEWREQVDTIEPRTMRFTGLANAAIDRIAPDLPSYVFDIARYAESDLFCYRATEPEPLVARQIAVWNPLLDWAEGNYEVEFVVTQGITPVDQPEATLRRLKEAVARYDAFHLAPLTILTTVGGSLVAALALAEGYKTANDLWPAVSLDELWQEEMWGVDTEAQKARAYKQQEWSEAAAFLQLLKSQ